MHAGLTRDQRDGMEEEKGHRRRGKRGMEKKLLGFSLTAITRHGKGRGRQNYGITENHRRGLLQLTLTPQQPKNKSMEE